MNNRDTHIKYKDYKNHQSIVKGLAKGDRVIVTVNGKEVFNCVVLYGVSAHVNVTLQDKGELQTELTEEQKTEALKEFREKYNL